jgi:VCBS repeat-containing protein
VQVDARGHFVIDGLAAGNYEITATLYSTDLSRNPPLTGKQTVAVADGASTQVTITIDLAQTPTP